ncbi:MAG: serine hydrolase domain-containing protein [Acidimicrobiia bacterium]|nr:serine hydrolase domain-containing protein [Acidimicrobiia bacterium]
MLLDGTIHPDFGGVTPLLSKYLNAEGRFGGALCIYHRGEKVVDVWGGARDQSGARWAEDTMAVSYSTTKGVTATALHLLADRGLVDIDAPVATYWPEFAAAGKEAVTVRNLLTHTSGLHRIRGVIDHGSEMLDWDHMVAVLAAQPSNPPAGTGPGYHGITFGWLVGNIVRNVAGMSLSEFLEIELAAPLGLDGLYVRTPVDQRDRIATLMPPVQPGDEAEAEARIARLARFKALRPMADALLIDGIMEILRDDRGYDAEIPAVNGTFTARSLARLYAALGAGGAIDGVRIMSPEHAALLTELQVDQRDYVIKINMKWRLGYHRAFTFGRPATRSFGHFGFGGSGAWADPETDLAVAFVTNDNTRTSTPFADIRLVRLGGKALKIARRR